MNMFTKFFIFAFIVMNAIECSTRSKKSSTTKCDIYSACYPWLANGRGCVRGNNIAMVFQTQLAPQNYIYSPKTNNAITNITYAFCPRADELQAFNLTNIGSLSYTANTTNIPNITNENRTTNANNPSNISFMDSPRDQVYLWANGLGGVNNVIYPDDNSNAYAMIADYFSYNNNGVSQCNPEKETGEYRIGIVEFLIMNVTLINGKFQYLNGYPIGTGFVPTCINNICQLDTNLPCIGIQNGLRNCGNCATAQEASVAKVQVWTSYYGTDANGATMRSGAMNPMNYLEYSESSLLSTFKKGLNNGGLFGSGSGSGFGSDSNFSP